MHSSLILAQDKLSLLEQITDIANRCSFDPGKLPLLCHGMADPALVHEALEIVLARRIQDKHLFGPSALVTRKALQQSTRPQIASYHAQTFSGLNSVLEICTGVGTDTLAISRVVGHVTTIEADPLLADYARWNFKAAQANNIEVLTGRAEEIIPRLRLSDFNGLWCDPSRRDAGGKRLKNSDDVEPPLSFIFSLDLPNICGIKCSPASVIKDLPQHWKQEWIGFADECLEQTLWHIKNSSGPTINNNQIKLFNPDGFWTPALALKTDQTPELQQQITPAPNLPQGSNFFLIEPHAALVRSGQLRSFFQEFSINPLDQSDHCYGWSINRPINSVFYNQFQVIAECPLQPKKIQALVNEFNLGPGTEIKKRGIPLEPDEIRKQLRFVAGGARRVLLLTMSRGKRICFLANRLVNEC